MTWEAYIGRALDGTHALALHVYEPHQNVTLYVARFDAEPPELVTVENGHLAPPAMKLPYGRGIVEALRTACDEHLGARPDDYRAKYEEARDALTVERARVDHLLGRGA